MAGDHPRTQGQTGAELPSLLGGFFGSEVPGAGGLADLWQLDPGLCWENLSSAFAALIGHLNPGTVWMPGYLCRHMAAAVRPDQRRYFPLTAALEPELTAFDALQDGDLVLAVSYFGRPLGSDWRQAVAARPGVWFAEDCAQSLDTEAAPWSDWRLYSPRKLMGVAEGGVLVPVSDRAKAARMVGPSLPADPQRVEQRLQPMRLRQARPMDNALWHPLHQAAETAGMVSDRAMDPEAQALFATLDPAPMIAARRANFARLALHLVDHAVIMDPKPSFAPFGFPVRLSGGQRDRVLERMHKQGVYPAVHWREIAAPVSFADDHLRSTELATLPCDHRYDLLDMDRLAAVFQEALL